MTELKMSVKEISTKSRLNKLVFLYSSATINYSTLCIMYLSPPKLSPQLNTNIESVYLLSPEM